MATFHESFSLRLRGGDVWEGALRLLEPDITRMIDAVVVKGKRGQSSAECLAVAYDDSGQIGRVISLTIEASQPFKDLAIHIELVPKNLHTTAHFHINGRSRTEILGIRESLRERCADGPTARSKKAGSILDDELFLSQNKPEIGFNYQWSGSVFDDYHGSMPLRTGATTRAAAKAYSDRMETTTTRHDKFWSGTLKAVGYIGVPLFVAFLVYTFGWN